jgi:tripartite ATP-independent transporter DctM subunit
MSPELVTLLLFGLLIIFLVLGLPLTYVLGGIAVIFTYFLWGPQALYGLATRAWDYGGNFVLLAVPLFVFMSNMLMESGIAEDLYTTMYKWLGGLRGGLAMGTVAICALMAAMVGLSAAATVSMGLIALPSMLSRKYNKDIAIGCISAGGALGILIPPSVPMIVIGLFGQVSVGKLFAGGVFAGVLLAALFIAYIGIRCRLQPDLCPPIPHEEKVTLREKLVMLGKLVLPILVIISVLGAIFSGMATPTESAGVGSLATILCAAINRKLTWQNLTKACLNTFRLTGMVMWIMIGAVSFTALYTAAGAYNILQNILSAVPGGGWGVVITMQLILLVLGCLLDPGGIIMITTPLFFPLIEKFGFDPVWFGVLFIVNMELAYLTPPVGFNLFYMQAVVPKGITMADIIRSVWPFLILQAIGLVLCMVFPQIILWLPSVLIR